MDNKEDWERLQKEIPAIEKTMTKLEELKAEYEAKHKAWTEWYAEAEYWAEAEARVKHWESAGKLRRTELEKARAEWYAEAKELEEKDNEKIN